MSCAVCKTSINLNLCSNCKTTYYCSKKCQHQDWHRHKLECFALDTCPICFEPLTNNNFCQTKCYHRFHLNCFIKTSKNLDICPYCRTSI